MNTRDIAQQKAYELLQELGIDPATRRDGLTTLTLATTAFLNGWVYGIQDARRVTRETYLETVPPNSTLLRPQAG